MDNRPRSREKNVTSGGKGASRRGNGLGTGPVGSSGGFSGRTGNSGGGVKRAVTRGGIGLPVLLVGGYLLIKFLGGSGGGLDMSDLSGLTGGDASGGLSDSYSDSSGSSADYTAADTSVAAGSRAKRTTILGNGADQVTLMVYMCGTDLESKYGMASSDMQEMASAKFGDNVNLIIYTGGCSKWKTSGISSSTNQIYQIVNGQLKCLESDMGSGAMTDPSTLTTFIKYCSENFPANRNELILWDHGGGSVSGYGYDEKNSGKGSMDLAKLDSALSKAGVTFDFIGFDACLMATAETAFMAEKYADYLIASEETEPGIGWYYTNWLTKLGNDSSTSTLDIGKNIVDDFVNTCASKCSGQKTTLSVIDLAEFANTVPEKMSGFAQSISTELKNENYQQISDARYNSREFAQSSKIDQVDLVNLAENIGTAEANDLAAALKSAVKYNKTSKEVTNAYGVSVYFPYKAVSKVDSACSTYDKIGMDSDYSECIRQFASLETSGQIASGGTSSAASSLLGGFSSSGSDLLSQFVSGSSGGLFNSLMGSVSSGSVSGLDLSNISFMKDMPLSDEETTNYISSNYFDTSNLVWDGSGSTYSMTLSEKQWKLVHDLDKNMFYDDGEGYIDLGTDNVFELDENGTLVADTTKTWVSVNGQPVAYYHTDTTEYGNDRYAISGYVPAYLNGERVNLIIVYDSDNPKGYIAGASSDYRNAETDTVAKNLTELNAGDTLDFVCDYYTYSGEYTDSYYIGEQMTVTSDMVISDTVVGDGAVKILYRFTDIYNQSYWTEAIDIK